MIYASPLKMFVRRKYFGEHIIQRVYENYTHSVNIFFFKYSFFFNVKCFVGTRHVKNKLYLYCCITYWKHYHYHISNSLLEKSKKKTVSVLLLCSIAVFTFSAVLDLGSLRTTFSHNTLHIFYSYRQIISCISFLLFLLDNSISVFPFFSIFAYITVLLCAESLDDTRTANECTGTRVQYRQETAGVRWHFTRTAPPHEE